ncbi:hypothetical protein SUNI508_01589 [Seiridium unicorne]|uniref:Uncharacterized protein n=1 Tax=Seiridium unicorne TaxID=138068 RepID=A0ABR2UT30_9PEZI
MVSIITSFNVGQELQRFRSTGSLCDEWTGLDWRIQAQENGSATSKDGIRSRLRRMGFHPLGSTPPCTTEAWTPFSQQQQTPISASLTHMGWTDGHGLDRIGKHTGLLGVEARLRHTMTLKRLRTLLGHNDSTPRNDHTK